MSDDDLKSIISKYQQKSFELFNINIVLETQVENLTASIKSLSAEIEKLKKPKKESKIEKDFE